VLVDGVDEDAAVLPPLPPQPAKVAQNVRARMTDNNLFIIPPVCDVVHVQNSVAIGYDDRLQ